MRDIKFAVILVTCNRLKCLQTALEKYDRQTKPPKYILVVDNASSDGTREYLEQWVQEKSNQCEKIVYHCKENTGGSGGFSLGVEEGLKLDCDFLFLADDDAYAEPDMLEELEKKYWALNDDKVVAIGTAIINQGKYDITHRCQIKKGLLRVRKVPIQESFYQNGFFPIDTVSFVGAAVKKEAAMHVGLPKKDYFIWNDDIEYSLRLRKEGTLYCIPSSIMHHNVIYNKSSSWKDYYGIRNGIDMIRSHFPKRFFYCTVVERYIKQCSILAYLFRKRDKEYRRRSFDAIQDAIHYRFGKKEKYMPQS